MSWFNEQLKHRQSLDQQLLEDSYIRIAGIVLGDRAAGKIIDDRIITKKAVDDLLKYYHKKPVDIPRSITSHEKQLDYCLKPHGIMRRRVKKKEKWYLDSYGPILAYKKDSGDPVVLLPNGTRGYYYMDYTNGWRYIKFVTRKTADLFQPEAYCFYKPLPQRKIGLNDLIEYMIRCISGHDILVILLATLTATGIGMLIPRITKALTGPVIFAGRQNMLIPIAVCMLCFAISVKMIESQKNLLNHVIRTKTTLSVQSAMMMRIMSLPVQFFRNYSAGELASRATTVNTLCDLLLDLFTGAGLASLASTLYITQIIRYTPALVFPSVIFILLTLAATVVSSAAQIKNSRRQMEYAAKEAGMSYAMFSGIQKIKLAGAEKRFFARWLQTYADSAELIYAPPLIVKVNSVLTLGITLISNIVLYYIAAQKTHRSVKLLCFHCRIRRCCGCVSDFVGNCPLYRQN